MKNALLAFALLISAGLPSVSFAKNKPLCDSTPEARICREAHYSPHPDPALAPIYQVNVQAALDKFEADNNELAIGAACDWVGMYVNNLYLRCRFKTYYKSSVCWLDARAVPASRHSRARFQSAISCK